MASSDTRAEAGSPADGRCPHCGGALSLDDLARMAIGDGWERYVTIEPEPGVRAIVPLTTVIAAGAALRGEATS